MIGRRAIPLCLARGHEVTAVARSAERRAGLERLGARAVAVDLFDRDQLSAVLRGHDAVVNLATHMPASTLRMFLPGAWRENDRLRREASAALVDAALAAGIGRFVQESFAPVYPDRGDAWIDETTPIAPAGYNRTVADAEHAAARFCEAGGAGVVLRFAVFTDRTRVFSPIWFAPSSTATLRFSGRPPRTSRRLRTMTPRRR